MLKAFLFTAVVAGCTGTGAVQYSASAQVTTPELVEVEPGVQVVADYDQPVFYSDGFYWRYDAGYWYRSPYYNRAWVTVSAPPVAVRRIQRPEMYVHYRADARVRNREARLTPQPTPEIRRAEPTRAEIRDNRDAERREQERREEQRREQERQDAQLREQQRRDEQVRRDEQRREQQERRDDKRPEQTERRDEKREEHAQRRDEKRDEKAERREDKAERRDEKRDDHKHHH